MDRFKTGDIVVHFKKGLNENDDIFNLDYMYKILGEGLYTETNEICIIYQALYGDNQIFVRPKKMFESEVDKDKYPNATQKYRFERIICPIDNMDKKEFYSLCKNFWIAYKDEKNQLRHCRIIEIKDNYVKGKKKNGDRTFVSYDKILGLSKKPTKSNKNPIIINPSIKMFQKLKMMEDLNEELKQEYTWDKEFYKEIMNDHIFQVLDKWVKNELPLNSIGISCYSPKTRTMFLRLCKVYNLKENVALQKQLKKLIRLVIKKRNYDFKKWYEYNYPSDIYVDEQEITKFERCFDESSKEAFDTNYSDFIFSQYESVMDEVARKYFSQNFIDWRLWDYAFDFCDFLEDEVKNAFWDNYPFK